MKYRFPNNEPGAPSEFTVVPGAEPIPDETHGMNLGGPDGGKVVVMNEAAYLEYRADVYAFLSKVNPTGQIADIPFSEA